MGELTQAQRPMTFDAFTNLLLQTMEVEPSCVCETRTGLFDDIGIDSFQAFKMIIVIEAAAELDVPPPFLPEIYTLGDAYEYYKNAVDLAARAQS